MADGRISVSVHPAAHYTRKIVNQTRQAKNSFFEQLVTKIKFRY